MAVKNSTSELNLATAFEYIKLNKLGIVVKALATTTCLILFFTNNLVIFNQFASHKAIIASNLRYDDKLLFPAILLCNTSAFKNSKVPKMDLKYYFANTLILSDALISISIKSVGEGIELEEKTDEEKIIYNSSYTSELIQIDRLSTLYRGSCYKIEYKKQVS